MKKITFIFLLFLLVGCRRTAPQRPTYHTMREKQSGVLQEKVDTNALKMLAFNERQVAYARQQLADFVRQDARNWRLDSLGYWFLQTKNGRGDSLHTEQQHTIRLVSAGLDGTIIEEFEKSIAIGKREVPIAVDEELKRRIVGDKMELLVPWYLAYGTSGNEKVEPYTNLHIVLTILQ